MLTDKLIEEIKQMEIDFNIKIVNVSSELAHIAGHLSGISDAIMVEGFDKLGCQEILKEDSKRLLGLIEKLKENQ